VLTGQIANLNVSGVVRLRGRDFSGPYFAVRDTSQGYW
jgi:hypothetical protein